MKKNSLLSLKISTGTYEKFLSSLHEYSVSGKSTYTCVANVHMLVEAYKDEEFAAIVNSADLVTPDGMPLAKGLRLLHGKKQDRVAGMDLLPDLLKISETKNLKVFFYGGTQDMLDKTEEYCLSNYPELKISGLISPPFRPLSEKENEDYAMTINASGANFVFVALGCPKQEKWMAAMQGRINSCMVGIGGALPVMIGMQKRAPKWIQDASLEWLYRLGQEPKRLFKRYFYTNSLFLFLFTKEYLKTKLKIANS